MPFDLTDTIAAIASPAGSGPRGMIRISGTETVAVLRRLWDDFEAPRFPWRQPRQLRLDVAPYGECTLPMDVYCWPTPRSFTGQPSAELHTWSSPPLLDALLSQVLTSGARAARPGEFTLRSFLSGRIDLVQAESVLGIIDARNRRELEQALEHLAGGVSQEITALRRIVIDLLADLEAGLDFVEEDIEFVSRETVIEGLQRISSRLQAIDEQARTRMHADQTPYVVLAGFPNAGKSRLLNALAEGEHAIVAAARGTTRDTITATMNCHGQPVTLADTAGWEVDRQGIEALAQLHRQDDWERADLVLWCQPVDASGDDQRAAVAIVRELCAAGQAVLVVATMSDRPHDADSPKADVTVSAVSGAGLDDLVDQIHRKLAQSSGDESIGGSLSARCRESLREARQAAERGLAVAAAGSGDELLALELRELLGALGSVVGETYTDDILDRIFARFCIGK